MRFLRHFASGPNFALVLALFLGACGGLSSTSSITSITSTSTSSLSTYDKKVLNDHPVLYLLMNGTSKKTESDQSGNTYSGQYLPSSGTFQSAVMPNGDVAAVFDGSTQYLELADSDAFSPSATQALTIEAWMRPDVLEFPHSEGSGYVYWLGKGMPAQQEYALRMYSYTNTEVPPRPNRISGYEFNLVGGLGSGSYFQDTVVAGHWIHVVAVINSAATSVTYPSGYVKIYKNGVLRDTTGLDQFSVIPANGTAPLRVGTRSLDSFFLGAIGKVALYSTELTAAQALAHFTALCGSACP